MPVASYLFAVCLAIRLPFFFIDVINWDESTFILMGQSILDGHLPYTQLWDLKPPLAFVPYALFVALFGKSIVAVRLGGTIFVFLTSCLIYLIGERISHRRVGILAGTFFISLSSLIANGQAVMSEYMALLPLIGGLAVLILNRSRLVVVLVAGILLTVATLIRLNLAYVVVAVGLWILLTNFKQKSLAFWRVLIYSCGSLGTILLTYVPYGVTKQGHIWLSSVVLAPLSYSGQKTAWSALQAQINFILASISPLEEANNFLSGGFAIPDGLLPVYELPLELVGISSIVWIGGILGMVGIIKHRQNLTVIKKQQLNLLAIFAIATEISIIKSGTVFEHYYIQIIPFFALGAGWFWHNLWRQKHRFAINMAIALCVFIACKPVFLQYQLLGDRLHSRQPLSYGVGYEIADYLSRVNPQQDSIYMMSEHIVYWFSGLQPISKSTTHPSNIAKEYLLEHILGANPSTKSELDRILKTKPKFIIKLKEVHYLEKNYPSQLLLNKTLASQYKLIKEIQGREIYQKNS